MKLLRKRKKAVVVSIIFLFAFFLAGTVPNRAADVTSKDCYDGYQRCMLYYGWAGPFAYPYCLNGYMFCLLFVA